MQAEDRPIHFSTELLHAPVQHDRPRLQRLYYELSQTDAASYDSSDFSPPGPPKFYTRRAGKARSVAAFAPDRIAIAEEWVEIPMTTFLSKVEEIAARALIELDIERFVAQTATIRTTFGLTHFNDAKEFILDRVCQQGGRVSPHFGRPIDVGGIRFALPETEEHPGTIQVTIESYRNSQREVYVEVRGLYQRIHVSTANVELARHHIRLVQSFIRERIYPYLSEFDQPNAAG